MAPLTTRKHNRILLLCHYFARIKAGHENESKRLGPNECRWDNCHPYANACQKTKWTVTRRVFRAVLWLARRDRADRQATRTLSSMALPPSRSGGKMASSPTTRRASDNKFWTV